MTTTLTQGPRAAEFILWEANELYSRENGTLVSGQNLQAGTVLMDNGSGKLTAMTAEGTAGDLDGAAKGILINDGDASAADLAVAYLARGAVVNQNLLTYPAESTDGGEKAAANVSLALLNIIVR